MLENLTDSEAEEKTVEVSDSDESSSSLDVSDDDSAGKQAETVEMRDDEELEESEVSSDEIAETSLPTAVEKKEEKKKEEKKKEEKKKEEKKKEKKHVEKKLVKKKASKKQEEAKRKRAEAREKKKREIEERKAARLAEKERKKAEEEAALNKWWEDQPIKRPPGHKWVKFSHNGVLFPPDYEPHGVPLLYDGVAVELSPEQEEYATYFAQYLETPHMNKPQFGKNFFKDWQRLTLRGTPQGKKIRRFQRCDFRPIWEFLQERKEKRKNRSKEEKDAEKAEKLLIAEQYGFAMVDGIREKVGNYRVEPPGLFLGRGDHPQAGKIKERIYPEDVVVNISADAPVPAPPAGHEWKEVINNPTVGWVAFWRENIRGAFKYVWLSANSRVKGESDMRKFDVARRLATKVVSIRADYMEKLRNKDEAIAQLATALWVIDKLALRVGNEKGEDEADTVGCCSLRVEHISLGEDNAVTLKFLGKDSMLYENTVVVPVAVYKNMKRFQKGKAPEENLFDQINANQLNQHLKNYMPKLTAKVFRTYNASITLELLLDKVSYPEDNDTPVAERVLEFNRANREVAILCNHQRSLPPTHSNQMEKFSREIAQLKGKAQELEQSVMPFLEKKKKLETKKKKKKQTKYSNNDDSYVDDQTPTFKWWKLPSETDAEDAERKRARVPSNVEMAQRLLTRLQDRIKLKTIKRTEKDELKTVALGTSKINYIDPRIVVKWCNRADVPIARVFSKTLRDKFAWAIHYQNLDRYTFRPQGKGKKAVAASSSSSSSAAAVSSKKSSANRKRPRSSSSATKNSRNKKKKN